MDEFITFNRWKSENGATLISRDVKPVQTLQFKPSSLRPEGFWLPKIIIISSCLMDMSKKKVGNVGQNLYT